MLPLAADCRKSMFEFFQRRVRMLDNLLQQRSILFDQELDRRSIKQFRAVVSATDQPFLMLLEKQDQIELSRAVINFERRNFKSLGCCGGV